jgi:hypothetical protein
VDRDGQQLSATQTWNQAMADADHLALLNAIWTTETAPARQQRYKDLLLGALPPGYRTEPGHQARWLWRTPRAAELAGLDPRPDPGRRDRRAGPSRRPRHPRRHRRPHPPAGRVIGLACPAHGLSPGTDVDNAVLRHLAAHGEIADLTWQAPDDITAEHGEVFQAAIQACNAADTERAGQRWEKVQAIWSQAWSANYAALQLLQDTGLTRFSPVKPQQRVVASFEHHHEPAWPPAAPHPQHRHHRPDHRGAGALTWLLSLVMSTGRHSRWVRAIGPA